MESIDTMFQELQDLFNAPKVKKKKKKSFLPVGAANTVMILREQFKTFTSPDELVKHLFSSEGLTSNETYHFEALLTCIPTDSELDEILAYKDSPTDLDIADQFVLALVRVPDIRQKLRSLIFYDEFNIQWASLNQSLEHMRTACSDILRTPQLKNMANALIQIGSVLSTDKDQKRTAPKQDNRNCF